MHEKTNLILNLGVHTYHLPPLSTSFEHIKGLCVDNLMIITSELHMIHCGGFPLINVQHEKQVRKHKVSPIQDYWKIYKIMILVRPH